MKRSAIRLAALAALALSPSAAYAQTIDELDAYRAELSRTVERGDFEGYAALYHPDAVLVSGFSGESYPISQALSGWKQGSGIFRYTFTPEGGETTVAPVHFEALLVKKDGEWLMLMEYQKDMATEEEWGAVAE